jgi:DNA polymerase-3 subunit gamma/tau
MYQVLARRWRPQSFEQLAGQPHVARTLTNELQAGRLAHAYLFAGMRGTGKTTVARILAKCLNCERGPTPAPCGECAACREIAESRAMDVLEIDAASRTKVEQTRELLEMVSYAPVRDRYRVLIIDEAHMLSKASFNALLKTLEEPPPNVVFVLATTELHKILPTILSRCQVFEFRRIAPGELAAHLRLVCDKERIDISDAALDRLARAGEGSVRDSLSVLERVVAFCGERVTDEDVLRVLGAVRSGVVADMAAALARRDAAGMLAVLDAVLDEGHDVVQFWGELIAALRDLLLLRALPDRRDLLVRPPEDAEALARAAEGLSREDLTRAFQILADLEPGLKAAGQPRFLLEATLIRLASLGAVRPIEEVLRSLSAATHGEHERPHVAPAEKKKPPEPSLTPAAEPAEGPLEAGRGLDLVAAVREARPMLGAMLEASHVDLAHDRLVIRVPAGMEAVKRQLERADNLDLIRRQAERRSGRKIAVALEIAGGEAAAPAPPAGPTAPSAPARQPRTRPTAAREPSEAGDLLAEVQREPGVRRLLDAFEARVVDIQRLAGDTGSAGPGPKPTAERPDGRVRGRLERSRDVEPPGGGA